MAATIQQIIKPTRARGLDTSGNNNHAQIYSGRALEFDGVVDRFKNGTAVEGISKFADNKEWTFACWLYFSSTATGQIWYVGKDETTTQMFTKASDETLRFRENDGTYHVIHATRKVEFNTWYRQVVICNGTTWAVYMNGEEWGTVTPTDTQMHFNGWGTPYETGGTWHYFMDGMMSDGQVWDKAWTADDVSYDYLNPEQLALNRGGTSLTNSNLKLWYPMNDGHRGNQSYILDASNTGLGDELVTNGDFSDISSTDSTSSALTGWTNTGTHNSTHKLTISDGKCNVQGTGTYVGMKQNIVTSGRTYKVTINITEVTSGVLRIYAGTAYAINTIGTTTLYLTATQGNIEIRSHNSDALDITFDDFSVKEINAKNNATTVFYGDELITDTVNRDFSGGGHWTGYGSPSAAEIDSAKFSIETNGDGTEEGAQLDISKVDGAGGAHPIVAGRTYRVTADLDYISGNADGVYKFVLGDAGVNVKASDGSPNDGTITSTEEQYYADITTSNNTGALRIDITAGTNDEETVFTIDNVSVKEIGTAMGWTDADKQLDIPQTALQSYNQLAWFDGDVSSNKVVDDEGFTPDDFTTVSFWMFYNKQKGSEGLFDCIDWSGGANFRIYINSSYNIKIDRITASETAESETYSAALTDGRWHHILCVIPKDAGSSNCTIMIDGEEESFTTSSAMPASSRTITLGYGGGLTYEYFEGCITEVAVYSDALTDAEKLELYNDGKAADATTVGDNLVRYWRNNGLATWTNLANPGTADGVPTSLEETMLITAGVDSSRDSQGFLMNKQRTTNSLNLPMVLGGNDNKEYAVIPTGSGTSPGDNLHFVGRPFSFTCWVKTHYVTGAAQIIFDRGDGTDGYLLKVSGTGIPVFVTEEDGTEISATAAGSNGGLSSGVMTNDTWYFIAGTHEGLASSADQKLYVGTASVTPALITTQASGVGMETSAANLYIGQRFNGGLPYNGEIDDLCFYDNNELTLAEITRNYNAGKRSHR